MRPAFTCLSSYGPCSTSSYIIRFKEAVFEHIHTLRCLVFVSGHLALQNLSYYYKS